MDFKLVENKWQKFWEEHPEIFKAKESDFSTDARNDKADARNDKTDARNDKADARNDKTNDWNDKTDTQNDKEKGKKYVLVEFPYPSGSGLHVGHAFSFTGADVYARFKRMQGFNVMFPMGWDAFGLPTENYAIKMKKKPQDVTRENTDHFRKQMKRLAFSFDWSREVNTTDPNYYRWTQWIFIQLFKKGLAYKKEMPINWCPSCKIGLANEEVVDGKCERCGAEVSRRNISQWVVKITDYADKLIEGLKETDFIEKVKQSQINWIGKTSGVNIDYPIEGSDKVITCYSTRPDTNFGATFVVIAPEHQRIDELTTEDNREEVKKYIEVSRKKSELERTELQKEKTGVFTGSYCINRLTGKRMPIWVSDFVVLTAGTGVVVGVPAHDQRDYDFAKKHNIECIPVIIPKDGKKWDFSKEPYLDIDDALVTNSDFLNGMTAIEAKEKIIDYLEEKGWGKRAANYHLRDWIFSRQHYWGEPIPMIHCKECAKKDSSTSVGMTNKGWYPVPDEQLPIVLPEVEAYEPTDDGKSPLSKIDSFVKTKCPVCGGEAERETDTMPNWAGSDWYFLGYILANKINQGKAAFAEDTASHSDTVDDIFSDSQKELDYWSPVDVYIGGDEHNVLHLLYSRFIYKFLWDLGVLPKQYPEPYYKRISHGVILGPDNQRMSKSKGNVIVPEVVADKYGVDVVRMYLMFMGPFDSTMAWNENTLMGVKRFLERFEKFIVSQNNKKTDSSDTVKVIVNKTIKGVTEDLENFKYNTAIAKVMEALNKISNDQYQISNEDLKSLIKLIAPLAPYTAEELWSLLKGEKSIYLDKWPEVEDKFLVDEEIKIMLAVNGKVRSELMVAKNDISNKETILKLAKEDKKILEWIKNGVLIKEIYIPGKMVNLVIK